MNFRIRRMGDGIAGAIVATVILAGGAAYAAGTVIDDNPKGDTPSTDDRLGGFDASASTTSSTITTSTIDDRGGDRRSSTSSSTTLPTAAAPAGPAGAPAAEGLATAVADAGSVAVVRDGAVLRFGSVTPAAGWTVRVERDNAVEIEVSFLNGAARVDFNAELEDGQIRTKVRDRRLEGASSTTSTVPDDSPSTTTAPAATPVARTLQSAGGSVSVTITGSRVTLVAATPAAGFAADVRKSGPDTVEVRFTSGKRESRVEIRIENGVPRERVEDR